MRFTVNDEIDFPRALVWQTLRDQQEDFLTYLPSVDEVEVLESREEGALHHFVKRWVGSTQDIPSLIRPMVKPEITQWIDHATWDADKHLVTWWHEMGVLPGGITSKGTTRYEADGDVTIITIEGDFIIHPEAFSFLPKMIARRLAPALERFIIGVLKPNLRATNEAVSHFLEDQGH